MTSDYSEESMEEKKSVRTHVEQFGLWPDSLVCFYLVWEQKVSSSSILSKFAIILYFTATSGKRTAST